MLFDGIIRKGKNIKIFGVWDGNLFIGESSGYFLIF